LNQVFGVAKGAFAAEFDLELIDDSKARFLPAPTNDDERALCELLRLGNNPCTEKCEVGLIRTANCPQFGVM
jgi:hypothetical protein